MDQGVWPPFFNLPLFAFVPPEGGGGGGGGSYGEGREGGEKWGRDDDRLTFPSGRSKDYFLLNPGVRHWELGGSH